MIKQTLRRLLKAKTYTTINIVGIVLGFTVSSLLLMYAKKEYQSDNFFPEKEQIYRLEMESYSSVSKPLVDLLQQQVAEIEHITKYHSSWSRKILLNYNNTDYELRSPFYADSSFFSVFQFECLYGNLNNALKTPDGLVLTRAESERIFGKVNPVGEKILAKTTGFGILPFTVTAVIDDIPGNSSLQFGAAMSIYALNTFDWYKQDGQNWGTMRYSSFALIRNGVDAAFVENKINEQVKNHGHQRFWDKSCKLLSLNGLHFNDKGGGDGVFSYDSKILVNTMAIIGLLILIIACLNYFNLSIANLQERKKEIGIRKTIGAMGIKLFAPSFLETVFLFLFSAFCSLVLIIVILPHFNSITYSAFRVGSIFTAGNVLFILALLAACIVLFAMFPALYIGKQSAIRSLKNDSKNRSLSAGVRNGMIVFQFIVSIALIVCTIMLNKQSRFMIQADYGYNTKNIAYIPLSPESMEKQDYLEDKFEQLSQITEVAYAGGVFGQVGGWWGRSVMGKGEPKSARFAMMFIGRDFPKLMGLELTMGTEPTMEQGNFRHLIINQKFADKYELDEPLHYRMDSRRQYSNILGVVKDFNFNTYHEPVEPFAMVIERRNADIMYVQFNDIEISEIYATLNNMEKTWAKVSPNYPFEYRFMDEHFANLYSEEKRMTQLLTIASVISIAIALLGLIGMASYILTKRVKEIGVRRVNGAQIPQIIWLLNSAFALKVFVAFLVACPLAYLAINRMLQFYAYQAEVSWWVYFIGGFSTFAVSILSISWLTYKFSRVNPVETLRCE